MGEWVVMVECMTRDRGAMGWSLIDVTALCPLPRHIGPSLELVQPRKTGPFITERLLMGRKESNQTSSSQLLRKTRLFITERLLMGRKESNQTIKSQPQNAELSRL